MLSEAVFSVRVETDGEVVEEEEDDINAERRNFSVSASVQEFLIGIVLQKNVSIEKITYGEQPRLCR